MTTLAQEWDRVAPVIEVDTARLYRYAKCFRYIPHLDRPDPLICDVGCGEGSGLAQLAALGYGRLMGLEVSRERLRQARQRLGEDVGLVEIQPRGPIPLRDSSVDVVISAAVIEHTIDPLGHVRELARVVRPGGAVIISSDCYMYRLLQLVGVYRAAQPIDRALFPPTLIRYFESSGLRLVHSEGFAIPGEEFRLVRLIWLRLRKLVRRFRPRRAVNQLPSTRDAPDSSPLPDAGPWCPNGWIGALPKLVFSDENVFFLVRRA